VPLPCREMKWGGVLAAYVKNSNIFHSLENPSYLKTHDWHLMLGPLGAYILFGVASEEYEAVYFPYLYALGMASARRLSLADVDFLDRELVCSMTHMEIHLPEYYNNLNKHGMIHMVRNIRKFGPTPAYNMFRRELVQSMLAGLRKSQVHPEKNVMRSTCHMRISIEHLLKRGGPGIRDSASLRSHASGGF
jgi:hypothetical protein